MTDLMGERTDPEAEDPSRSAKTSVRRAASGRAGLGGAVVPVQASPTRLTRFIAYAREKHLFKVAGTLLSLAILGLSVFVLFRTLTTIDWADLRHAIFATGNDQLALAVLFTAASYLALTGYDALAVRQLRLRVPYRTTALASFTSYAVSFTLGFPLITAGTVRYWIYSQANVSAGKVASLTVIAGVTFWLGMALVLGLSLTFAPSAIGAIDRLTPSLNLAIGLSVLAAIGVYLVWVSRGHRRTRIQGLKLELPGLGLTVGQIVLGVADLCSAAAVLYALLPAHTEMPFHIFAASYVFACLLGIASNAPGGIGAFEATMLNIVPSQSQGALLASLLMFRVIYYFVPFLLALALLGAREIWRRWTNLRTEMEQAETEQDQETPG